MGQRKPRKAKDRYRQEVTVSLTGSTGSIIVHNSHPVKGCDWVGRAVARSSGAAADQVKSFLREGRKAAACVRHVLDPASQ